MLTHDPTPVTTIEEETILGWFGPVSRSDMKDMSSQDGIQDNISGENTILATNLQIILLRIGPNDVKGIPVNQTFVNIADNFAGSDFQSSPANFDTLYANQWGAIIDKLKSQPLAEVIHKHHHLGIPYSAVKEIIWRKSFINPGIRLKLNSGENFAYAGFSPKILDNLLPALEGKVVLRKARLPLFVW